MSALIIKDLQKTYSNGTQALGGVSLTVESGDFFALLGPNGAGKTTLISILSSLLHKTSGSVTVGEFSIDTQKDDIKALIGLVPQEFNCNIFEKVIDIVVDQAGYYGIERTAATVRAEQLLKDLGLYEKRFDKSQTLSGGMKRRLLIARALIHNPKILLLDEPTAGVDVELRRSMWEFLTRVNAEGTTIILTTHYLEEAQMLCKNMAIIKKGAILVNDTMDGIIQKHNGKKLEDIYLEYIA
jgi:ABC-2 type transport system ATP-binding protein